ncbi:hypothetical protein [Limnohabitans sp. Rim8]|uniref:hypothetical protein n=1 Tax=Limnohabitans sp. Rim8 TaxID=1100718 RepID=UPI002624EE8B|nr:hypothetical protein [Limnohabitans sp. Rim8]
MYLRHQQPGLGGGFSAGLLFNFHIFGPGITAQSAKGNTHCGRLSAVFQQNSGQCAYTRSHGGLLLLFGGAGTRCDQGRRDTAQGY